MMVCMWQVELGAGLFDEWFPGWADRVDLAALDMRFGSTCVAGQVVPESELVRFGAEDGYDFLHNVLGRELAEYCGFTCGLPMWDPAWSELREAWVEAIGSRRSVHYDVARLID